MIPFWKTTGKTSPRPSSAFWILEVFYLILPRKEICIERTRFSMPCVCKHYSLWPFFLQWQVFSFCLVWGFGGLLKKRPAGGSSAQRALLWCAWQVSGKGSSHRGWVTFQSEVWGHHQEGKRQGNSQAGRERGRRFRLSTVADSLVMDLRRPAGTWFLRLRICLVDSGYAKQAGSKWLKIWFFRIQLK